MVQDFVHPKKAEELGVSPPQTEPSQTFNPRFMPRLETGARYADIIGSMILVMSASHGQGETWLSVPYHMLYFQWIYRELGIKAHPPVPGKVPTGKINRPALDDFPNPESVTYTQAEETLANTVRYLITEGYLVGIRDGEDDHLVPTNKLVNSISQS